MSESQIKEIREFLHDLKNPISVITGYLELVEEMSKNKEIKEALSIIEEQSNKARELIEKYHKKVKEEYK